MGGSISPASGRGMLALIILAITAPALSADQTKVHGRVLDANGKPVSGADVYLVDPRGYEPGVMATSKSDPAGGFEFTAELPDNPMLNPVECQVLVPGKGLGAERVLPEKDCVVQLKSPTRITLTMLDPDGKPVAGMKVYPTAFVSGSISMMSGEMKGKMFFMRSPRAIRQRMEATTGPDGKVTLADIPLASKFELAFDNDRFAYPGYSRRFAVSENQPESPPLTVQLVAGATVSGIVRYGSSGKGAASIEVSAQATDRNMQSAGGSGVRTNPDGSYRIAHLLPGEYNVMLNLGLELQKDWAAAGHEWVKLTGGQTIKDMDFSLIKGGIVKGKVITADTAEPIAGSSIGVHGPAHPQSSASIQYTETGPDGEYSIRVPPGLQHVYVSGLVPEAYRQQRQDIRDITVEDGQVLRLDFRLDRRDGESVKGIVIGLDGKPAPDVVVLARVASGMFGSNSAKTDAQGRFHFDAIPADTQIEVKFGEVGTAEPVAVRRGQGEIRLQLVPRIKLTLKGLITDENDKPVPNARIKLSHWFGNSGISEGDPLITDANGRYEIKGLYLDSQYNIAADADGFGEKQAKLELHENLKDLPTLALPRADATTGGIVVDEDGKPVAGISVRMNNGMSPKTCVTDKQGRFSFQVVPGANHMVSIAVKQQGKVGPNGNAIAGKTDLKLVLPKTEQ